MQETDLFGSSSTDRTTGEHRNLSEATDRSIASFEWVARQSSLYVTFENHGEVSLARLELGQLAAHASRDGVHSGEPDVHATAGS